MQYQLREKNSNSGHSMLGKCEVGTVFQTKRDVNVASFGAIFREAGLLRLAV